MRKTKIRFFMIADYEDEELWLRKQHQNGWKLVQMTPPCFFTFEECEPEDVVYRLDFKNGKQTEEYMQMLTDFGWEYVAKAVGWLYFRKPANAVEAACEAEIFSDNASRVDMAEHVTRTRLLPLMVIFLCCVVPNLINAMNGIMGRLSTFFGFFFGVMFGIYLFMIIYNGIKLNRIRAKYKD